VFNGNPPLESGTMHIQAHTVNSCEVLANCDIFVNIVHYMINSWKLVSGGLW